MPKGIGYAKKTKKVHKVFKKSEKQKIQKHYETQDPENIKPYKSSRVGKAAHKRARKGKTSRMKKGY